MSIDQSEKAFLKSYNVHDYDVPLMTVDMAIFTVMEDRLHVLLVKRSQHPAMGQWALPGGFVDLKQDKELRDTARRKLKEKTGIDTPYLEQVETFGNAQRDPRGWSVTVAYFALVARDYLQTDDAGSEEIAWVAVDDLSRQYKLAFDHNMILQACYERLQAKVHYTSLPIHLLPEAFTLSELQHIFEIILNKNIEKKSFRRRMLEAGIVEETGDMKTGNSRPAKLYCLKDKYENYFFSRNIEGSR